MILQFTSSLCLKYREVQIVSMAGFKIKYQFQLFELSATVALKNLHEGSI